MEEFAEEVFEIIDSGDTAEILVLMDGDKYIQFNMEKKDEFMTDELNTEKVSEIIQTLIDGTEAAYQTTAISIALISRIVDLADDDNPYGLNLN